MRLTQPVRDWNSYSTLYPRTTPRSSTLLTLAGSWRGVGPKQLSGLNEPNSKGYQVSDETPPTGMGTTPLVTYALN